MAKINLTTEHVAAIMAGSRELDLGEATPAAGAASVPATPAAAASVAAALPSAAASAPGDSGVVAFLTSQLAEKDANLLETKVKLSALEASVAEAQASLPALVAIAQGVVGQMQVALGNADSSAALGPKDVVAAHASILPVFKTKFPVGGIASTAQAPEAETSAAEIHPLFAERLQTLAATAK